MTLTALIVQDPDAVDDSTADLLTALLAQGATVRLATSAQILLSGYDGPVPEMLLVYAGLSTADVATLTDAFVEADRPPAVVIFAGQDPSLLQQHLHAGHDYLLPPYPPWLVRSRLNACQRREELTTIAEEMSAAGQLLKYERELQIGRDIQRGFLPGLLPCPNGWEVAARFRPARVVAGDFYDVFELSNGRRTAFVVADVCDKGVGAALFMALIRTLLRHTAQHSGVGSLLVSDLQAIVHTDAEVEAEARKSRPLPAIGAAPLISAVRGTNDYLTRNHMEQGYFATLFFCILDPHTGGLTYINGGHNPPLVLRHDGQLELLEPTGPAVGLIPGSAFKLGHTTLHEGETLFAYTDGVTEAKNEHGEFFSERRMHDLLRQPVKSANDLLDQVDWAVHRFAGPAEQFDDVTMLALRRLPVAGGAGGEPVGGRREPGGDTA
jgi:sigma-B regulation protein RsbU (phosphoserine phosphatase)